MSYNIEKTEKKIKELFEDKNYIILNLKNGKELIISKNSDGTYHLYEGCDLVVGDVSLLYIAYVITEIGK